MKTEHQVEYKSGIWDNGLSTLVYVQYAQDYIKILYSSYLLLFKLT